MLASPAGRCIADMCEQMTFDASRCCHPTFCSMLTRTHLFVREGSGFSTYDWAAPEVGEEWYMSLLIRPSRRLSLQQRWFAVQVVKVYDKASICPAVAVLQVLLGQGATEKSDVWSLGVILWELCSGGWVGGWVGWLAHAAGRHAWAAAVGQGRGPERAAGSSVFFSWHCVVP